MADFPALPLWTDAYIADTMHLSCLESGAYLHLLIAAWRSPDCRLPADDAKLARMAKCTPREWSKARDAVMAFWTLEDVNTPPTGERSQKWSQKRLLREREFVLAKSEKAKRAAEAKYQKDKDTGHADAVPEHPPKHMPGDMLAPCSDDAPIPTPTKKEEANASSKERGSRLPDGWEPDEGLRRWCRDQGYTDAQVAKEAPKFRDYWRAQPGAKGRKADWSATFRNWMRNSGAPAGSPGGNGSLALEARGKLGSELTDEERLAQENYVRGCNGKPPKLPNGAIDWDSPPVTEMPAHMRAVASSSGDQASLDIPASLDRRTAERGR